MASKKRGGLSPLGALRIVDHKAWVRQIRAALKAHGCNLSHAAKHLGVSDRSLWRWTADPAFRDLVPTSTGDAPRERDPEATHVGITPTGALRRVDPEAWAERVRAAIQKAGGRVPEAAQALGISPRQLWRLLKAGRFEGLPRAPTGVHAAE